MFPAASIMVIPSSKLQVSKLQVYEWILLVYLHTCHLPPATLQSPHVLKNIRLAVFRYLAISGRFASHRIRRADDP